MAIGLRIKFIGGSQDHDALHAKLGVEDNPPPGLLFHASGPVDDGWGI